MTLSRIYVEQNLVSGETVDLDRERAHYVGRVLRLAAGDTLNLFNERDGEFAATLEEVRGARARATVGEAVSTTNESPLTTCLIQGLCRSHRMDYCVQKASELGVTRILPVRSERCVVRLDARRAQKRLAHWRAVAISACEQSGRTLIPQIESPIGFDELLVRDDVPGLALLDPDAGTRFAQWQLDGQSLSLAIGPEGGFTAAEVQGLADRGAARWRMGPRVFRTETAGVVALALAQARWGDLG